MLGRPTWQEVKEFLENARRFSGMPEWMQDSEKTVHRDVQESGCCIKEDVAPTLLFNFRKRH